MKEFTKLFNYIFLPIEIENPIWYNAIMKENENIVYLNNPEYDILTEHLFNMPDNHQFEKTTEEIKSRVYHCSNERLNSYFKDLNLKGKIIATVGSSGDQVLNAIFYGAKDITLIDANIFTRAYFEYKTAMIKNFDFDEFIHHLGRFSMFNWKTYSKISHNLSPTTQQFFDELMLNQENDFHYYDEGYLTDSLITNNLFHTPCYYYNTPEENLFYNNEEDYLKLKKLLIENNYNLKIINADITEFPSLLQGKFDYIFLSNIYEYVDKSIMIPIIKKLYKKINKGGAIQYYYTYGTDVRGENLISKLARYKRLRPPYTTAENLHHVYFIDKPQKENILELIK